MPSLSRKTLLEVRGFLDDAACSVWPSEITCRHLVEQIDAALKPKRSLAPARTRRQAKRLSRKERVAEIRAAVIERSGGRCEFDPLVGHAALVEMDHFHGGSNRRALESVEGCWLLCRYCHVDKTRSWPFRATWLKAFLRHSDRHGYNSEPQRKARAELESLQIQGRGGKS